MTNGEPKNVSARFAKLLTLWRSFWFGPALVVAAAILLVAGAIWIGREGASSWLVRQGLAPSASGDMMREALSALVAVQGGFAALYVSITLIVLTLAAGQLGARLIDRWIARPFVRRTLGFFLGILAGTLLLLITLDDRLPPAQLPQLALLLVALLTLVMTVWLAVALHDLGRASFVDTSIAWLKRDCLAVPSPDFRKVLQEPWPDAQPIRSRTSAYICATDIEALSKLAARHDTMFRLDRTAGDHVLKGQLIGVSRVPISDEAHDEFLEQIGFDETRSDQEGLSYRVRLLVELAARALSPGINDFYTARAAVDALAAIMLHERGRLTRPGELLMEVDRVICPTASFAMIFHRPMDALRQAAAPYPAIATRIVERLGTAAALADDQGFTDALRIFAQEIAQHAAARAETEIDRADLALFLESNFAGPSDTDTGRPAKGAARRVAGNVLR